MSKKFHRPGRDFRAGELFRTGLWIKGEYTEDGYREIEHIITRFIEEVCTHHGRGHMPVTFHTLRPGEEGCPMPDSEIQGDDVRFYAAECEIFQPVIYGKSLTPFVDDLPMKAKQALREATRRAHYAAGGLPITDAQCDQEIERYGPDVAAKMIGEDFGEAIH